MNKTARALMLFIFSGIGMVSCTDYGDQVAKDSVEVYYKDNISKEQAQQTLDLLHPSWSQDGNKKSVQLVKKGDTVFFRMVINEEKAKTVKDDAYYLLANGLSTSIFNGSPVNVDLTDEKFNTTRTLHFKQVETTENFGTKSVVGNIEVYSKPGIHEKEAMQLAEFLAMLEGESGDTKSFQADKDSNGIYTISMVSSPEKAAAVPEKEFYDLAGLLSDSVFNGAPLNLQLTDYNFKPHQVFQHKRQ